LRRHTLCLVYTCWCRLTNVRNPPPRLQRLLDVSVHALKSMSPELTCPLKGIPRKNKRARQLAPLGLAWTALGFASQSWTLGSCSVDMRSSYLHAALEPLLLASLPELPGEVLISAPSPATARSRRSCRMRSTATRSSSVSCLARTRSRFFLRSALRRFFAIDFFSSRNRFCAALRLAI